MEVSVFAMRQFFRSSAMSVKSFRNVICRVQNHYGDYKRPEKVSTDIEELRPVSVTEKKSERKVLNTIAGMASMTSDTMSIFQSKYDFSLKNILKYKDELERAGKIKNQLYLKDRHKTLGSNLASAHFIVARGGTVRFEGETLWHRLDPKKETYNLPKRFIPNMYVEAIDTTGMELLYEGLDNFTNLTHLKKLILSGPDVDDWFLDRLHIFSDSLEYLEVNKCPLLTLDGICNVHKLKHLKTLKLRNLPHLQHIELLCLLIEDYFPNCEVTYSEDSSSEEQTAKN